MQMIPNIWRRRKILLEAVIVPAIIVLVALAAFGLGRLSVLQSQQDKLIIHQPGEAASSDSQQTSKEIQ